MKYRKLGRTGLDVSEIGMGLEHLLDKDEQTVADVIKAAVNGGVNYLDCHPGDSYDSLPGSELYDGYIKLGKALKGIRDKVYISYIAYYLARTREDAEPRFESYLRALGTGYTDVFIIQFCDKVTDYEQVTGEGGLLSYVRELQAKGKVRHIGISTHSSDIACRAINSGEFDVLMYPVNPAFDVITVNDIETLWDAAYDFTADGKNAAQPRKNVYNECERNNIGLIAMKPFAGGFIFRVEKDAGFTPVNLISYALEQNGVSTVVPGCTEPKEIEEILTYNSCPDNMRDYSRAVAKSRWSVMGNCLYCNHCRPCGAGINIGQVNRLLDAFTLNTNAPIDDIRKKYSGMSEKASACVQCGVCMERCPFKVNIIDRMKHAARVFEIV